MSSAFKTEYDQLVAKRQLEYEPDQDSVVAALDRVARSFGARNASKLGINRADEGAIKGVYIWGNVGRGKSMLMNLLFEQADCPVKRRLHFHAFMQEVHAAMQTSDIGASVDSIARAAATLWRDAHLLCLDELEIIDIADAMIVGRLFEQLFARGLTLVATSNNHPDQLYHDGPNREAFLPFVENLKKHVDVVELSGARDFRSLSPAETQSTYLSPVTPQTRERFDELWRHALKEGKEHIVTVAVHGRKLTFHRSCGPNLRVAFSDVCQQPMSADDHLAIASRFATIFLEGIPIIPEDYVDEGRRLVTLIDALYESKARLIVLAAAPPERLFATVASEDQRRTISRLNEMESGRWSAATG